jgi:hypothetical protein
MIVTGSIVTTHNMPFSTEFFRLVRRRTSLSSAIADCHTIAE